MLTIAASLACLISLLPVAVVGLLWRSKPGVPHGALALAVPSVVALDLLGILLLTFLVRLEVAALVMRAFWLVSGVVLLLRGYTSNQSGHSSSRLRSVAITAVAAGFVSWLMSRQWSTTYSVWDREWHIPLVSSLRGQVLPFQNVYYFPPGLHYHISGDVLAATIQAYSFGVLHSDHALSLAHDVVFALSGVCIALVLDSAGYRSVLSIALATLAVILNGPVSILRGGGADTLHGYSVLNFFTMSFRPHVNLAGLLFIGFLGAVIGRLRPGTLGDEGSPLLFRPSTALLATTGVLAIADETSVGLLGLALGVAWLAYPDVIHPSRVRGALVLVGMLVACVGTNLLFAGSLAPGGPVSVIKWVPWRSPGYFEPPVPLETSDGWRLLFFDTFALPVSFSGILLSLSRSNVRQLGVAVLFLSVLYAGAYLGLTHIDVNGAALEAHRFATVALFAAALFALVFLPLATREPARLVLLAALLIPAVSTASWFRNKVPGELAGFRRARLGSVNCREHTGQRWLERARAAYVSDSVWYLWAGCHPTLTPGVPSNHWGVPITNPRQGWQAVSVLEQDMLGAADPLRVICPASASSASSPQADPVCAVASNLVQCKPAGTELARCLVSADSRPALRPESAP